MMIIKPTCPNLYNEYQISFSKAWITVLMKGLIQGRTDDSFLADIQSKHLKLVRFI